MHKAAKTEAFDTKVLAKQLAPTIQYLSKRYTSGLSLTEEVPAQMRRTFYEDLASFDRTMATALSSTVVNTFEKTDTLDDAFKMIGPAVQEQSQRLSNILQKSDEQFRSYLALGRAPDYPFYLFLSENSSTTCERCAQRHGKLFRMEDIFQGEVLPPLHLNCRCRLVAMDGQMANHYLRNSVYILTLLDDVLNNTFGESGGVFYLTHGADQYGINAQTVGRMELPMMSVIADMELSGPTWYEELGEWALNFARDAGEALDAFFRRGSLLFVRADETLKKNPILGLILWADALAFGLPSAIIEGFVHRWEDMNENPSVYTVLNFFTLGIWESVCGAFCPEEPLSFQHFVDMLSVLTLIYGMLRFDASDVLGMGDDALGLTDDALGAADDVLGLTDGIAGKLDDLLDDGARAAAGSVDDLLDDVARQAGEIVKKTPADDLNNSYLKLHPNHEPPYWPGTQVYEVCLTRETGFVRVYGGSSKQVGGWIINANDIAGLTAEQIRGKFSLPQAPTHICDVTVPAGTTVEISGASGILGGSGGGVQFYIAGDPSEVWFTSERLLK